MSEIVISTATIIIFLLLIIYIIGGAFIEKKHCIVGHETGIAILLGFLVSFITKEIAGDEFNSLF